MTREKRYAFIIGSILLVILICINSYGILLLATEAKGILEHYTFYQQVDIFYLRTSTLYPPYIYVISRLYAYNKALELTPEIYERKLKLHVIENYFCDEIVVYTQLKLRETKNWGMTIVDCSIVAKICGAKTFYTYNITIASSFFGPYRLAPQYNFSPFSGWFWLEASPKTDFEVVDSCRAIFVRNNVNFVSWNRSNQIVIFVQKDSNEICWNFSMVVGLKDISFKNESNESYIHIIANIRIYTYEIFIRKKPNSFAIMLIIMNIIWAIIFEVIIYKLTRKCFS